MPLRVLMILVCLAVFLASTLVRAEDCTCPVLQCEPCQKKLVLGTHIKECRQSPAVVCQKVVCENVDNFFQCIAGAPPLYIPPQDPSLRYTEPRYTPPAAKEIDFTKLAVKPAGDDAKKIEDISPAVESEKSTEKVEQRALASVSESQPVAPEKMSVQIKNLKGALQVNGKPLKTSSLITLPLEIRATQASQLSLFFGKDHVKIKLTSQTRFKLLFDEGVVMIQKLVGEAQFEVAQSRDLFVVDIGSWRWGKKSGEFKIKTSPLGVVIENTLAEAYLRRETVISPAELIPSGRVLQFTDGVDLYSSTEITNPEKQTYTLVGAAINAKQKRQPAADSFCQAPAAQFEQCAWKCFGSQPNDKGCSSKKSPVQCVRFTCSADGQWKLPTLVSEGECSGSQIHVGLCH